MVEGDLDLSPPRAVRRITRRLEDAGYSTWAVGGAVRDRVLGRTAGDWDLATRATPQEVMKLFRRTVPVGVEHGTVGVLEGGRMYEVTTFRRDVETFGRHAVVAFADTVEEDLSRRDFTINALAWHPLTGELLDPFGGRSDLEEGVLRTVGAPADRFAEDHLRVLRALRFAGHFGLAVESDTWAALRAATPHLPNLSAERVREELMKTLAQGRTASRSLQLYREAGVLEVLYPELAPLPQERPADAGADLWTISIRAVDAVPPHRPRIRMAALLHAIGMPPARTKDLRGGWRYTGHEVLGGRKAEDVMRRLKSSNADTDRVTRLVRHQSDLFPPDAPDAGVRRWLRQIGPDLVPDLFRLRFALWRGAHPDAVGPPEDLLERSRKARRVLRSAPALSTADLAIGGGDLKALGLAPGPRFSEILSDLLERVTDDPALNRRDRLIEVVRTEWNGE
ncbi:MAG TPA: CCA tRNA nucleotidyltransferase [Longimicrobiales bacterium]|nr:CCA tRNA nucleotidyltransferase [Longimicrobiales bacterium]